MKPRLPYFLLLNLLLVAAAQAQTTPAAMPVHTVASRGVSLAVSLDGVVEALHQATVAAQVQGRILEVRVDAGQRVQKGQLLARIDARESAEAVAAARAGAASARATLERTKKLLAQRFISAAALDKAQADVDTAEAQLQAAQAGTDHARIVSPLSGMVAVRHVEAGEMAVPGRPLFSLYAPGGVRLVVHVPQSRLAEVKASRSAVVEFVELGQRVDSRAITVLPTIDEATHTATVRIDLPAQASFAVPGMAARVHFQSGERVRITVPKRAIVQRGEVAGVYVRDAQGRFRLRQLRLGESVADGEVEVLAGLLAGETIALDPVRAVLQARQ